MPQYGIREGAGGAFSLSPGYVYDVECIQVTGLVRQRLFHMQKEFYIQR